MATKKAVTALKKANSHLKNVVSMAENNAYCIDILQQILAVQGLLKSASNSILEGHINSCFKAGLEKNDVKLQEKLISEILSVTSLNQK